MAVSFSRIRSTLLQCSHLLSITPCNKRFVHFKFQNQPYIIKSVIMPPKRKVAVAKNKPEAVPEVEAPQEVETPQEVEAPQEVAVPVKAKRNRADKHVTGEDPPEATKSKKGKAVTLPSSSVPEENGKTTLKNVETEKKSETKKPATRVKKTEKVESETTENGGRPKRAQTQKNYAEATVDEPKIKKSRGKKEPAQPLLNPTETVYDKIDFTCTKKNDSGETYNLKIASWNVGGIRSWLKKGGLDYIKFEKPDILFLQETKCGSDKLPEEVKTIDGYENYWCDSVKDGYAGVAIFTKKTPLSVENGIGNEEHDEEGRCITIEYDNFYLVGVYVPNSGRKLVTLPKRLEWNEAFKAYVKKLDEKKPVILCGDMNVSHNEIDLANPKTNTKNAGFTKEERDGLTDFLSDGYVDTFRKFYPDQTGAYTFWSYMKNSRSKNIGWRLDYFIVSERITKNLCDNVIRHEVLGSDHCPIVLFVNI